MSMYRAMLNHARAGLRRGVASWRQRRQLWRSGRSVEQTDLDPVILTANGRSGTTYMMELLDRHPAICLYRRYPYEHNQAAYLVNLYRNLNEPADDSIVNLSYAYVVARHQGWISRNPYLGADNEATLWYRERYRPATAGFCRTLASDYYRHLGGVYGKQNPRYFAEYLLPSLDLVDGFQALWPQTREILLVRDMRDLYCSITAFNAKRGHLSFGREFVDSEDDYIDIVLNKAAADMLAAHRERGDRLHVVRYEDLVTRTETVLYELLQYLGLENGPALIGEMCAAGGIEATHRTSADAGQSIGKWREQLDDAMTARCNRVFADYHRTFGYDLE